MKHKILKIAEGFFLEKLKIQDESPNTPGIEIVIFKLISTKETRNIKMSIKLKYIQKG